MTEEIQVADHREAVQILRKFWDYPAHKALRSTMDGLFAPIDEAAYTALLEPVNSQFRASKTHAEKVDRLFWRGLEKPYSPEERAYVASQDYVLDMLDAAEAAIAFLEQEGPVKMRGPLGVVSTPDPEGKIDNAASISIST